MTIDTKRLRELAEAATVENCQRAGENPGAMLQRFYEAFTRDTALALLDEIERLRNTDIGEALLDYDDAAIANESLRAQLTAMTRALVNAHDALANLRAGRWEIGYVKERVDRVLAESRSVIEGKEPQ